MLEAPPHKSEPTPEDNQEKKLLQAKFRNLLQTPVREIQDFSLAFLRAFEFYCRDKNLDFKTLTVKDLLQLTKGSFENSNRFTRKILRELLDSSPSYGFIAHLNKEYFSGETRLRLGMRAGKINYLADKEILEF